jgi:hypothetical protein
VATSDVRDPLQAAIGTSYTLKAPRARAITQPWAQRPGERQETIITRLDGLALLP